MKTRHVLRFLRKHPVLTVAGFWYALLLALLVVPWPHSDAVQHQSCAICGSEREVVLPRRWWIPLRQTERVLLAIPGVSDHQHEWSAEEYFRRRSRIGFASLNNASNPNSSNNESMTP